MTDPVFNREAVTRVALDAYPNKSVFNEEEFKKDLYRFFIVRRMSRRFVYSGNVNYKLFLNNVIICLNIFRYQSIESDLGNDLHRQRVWRYKVVFDIFKLAQPGCSGHRTQPGNTRLA